MLKASDYRTELTRIEKTIADLQGSALVPPTDTEKVTTYVSSLYQRATLTGNLVALEATDAVIDEAIRWIRLPVTSICSRPTWPSSFIGSGMRDAASKPFLCC